jgi:anti-anti-sigma regulatory factor
MLRITIHDEPKVQTMQLEGKIVGPWVDELRRTWRDAASSRGSKKLNLDLRDVAFVDDNGKRLLRDIYQQTNASFIANSPLSRYFAQEAMYSNHKNSNHDTQGG